VSELVARRPFDQRLEAGAWRPTLSTAATVVACVVWAAGVVLGFRAFWSYEVTPGAAAEPPAEWPSGSAISRLPDRPTLVMLAHPRCACTRASLVELGRVIEKVDAPLAVYVLFARPAGAPDDWEDTATWASARALPGVTVLRDEHGSEAGRFGAVTSGQTVVYDAGGRLVFSGGITGARGQKGDNVGRRRLLALLATGSADRRESDVFGCALHDPPAPAGPIEQKR
jgi:hypothetical protein